MNLTVNGLVLRSVNYRESDKILTVLTPDRGRITVKASGARRKGSRLGSGSQPFCYSEMALFERGGRYTLDEVDVREQFYGLSSDIEKMALAGYLAQVLLNEPEESPGGEAVMRLALNSLYGIERGLFPLPVIKAAFELKYMAMGGYAPDLSACGECSGGLSEGYISIESGLAVCRECRREPRYDEMYLDRGAMQAARYILTADLKRLFSFEIPASSMGLLSAFCEKYLIHKTEQSYKALDFYNSLFEREEKQ